jgi:hypothetical protein
MKKLLLQTKNVQYVFIVFLAFMSVWLKAQPLVFYTSSDMTSVSGFTIDNYRIALADRGNYRQVIFQNSTSNYNTNKQWAFHIGTTGSPNYNVCWRPYNGGSNISINTITAPNGGANIGALYNSNSGGQDGNWTGFANANTYVTVNVTEYTFDNFMAVWETAYLPNDLSGATHTAGFTTVTLGSALASGENMFVRASTDGFITSAISQVSFSGTTGTVTLPSSICGSSTYYFYTSSQSLSAINALVTTHGQLAHDMASLYLIDDGGAKYSTNSNSGITAFNMTGGGTYCAGGSGVLVGLAGSQSGVSYQLKKEGTDVGSPILGTGSAFSFGYQTAAGVYTVLATSGSCSILITNNGSAISQLPTSGLVAYYPFSGNANDLSSFGNNATTPSGYIAPTMTTDRHGNMSSAYLFSGINSFLQANDAPQLRPQNLTLSHWAYIDNNSGIRSMVGKSYLSTVCDAYTSFLFNGNFAATSCSAISNNAFPSGFLNNTTASTGVWKFVTYVFDDDNNTLKLYIDGVLVNSITSWNNPLVYDNAPLQIGASLEGGNLDFYFAGKLDDIRLYNRVLSNAEITALYQETPTVVTVNTPASPSVSIAISSGTNPTCTGTGVTFTATPTNGGMTPSYQWKKDGSDVGSNIPTYTDAGTTAGAITCDMTSSAEACSVMTTSNSISLAITPLVNAGALHFDGSNDQVNIGGGFNKQVFAIEMWIKPAASQAGFANIIDNNHGNGVNWVCQTLSGNNTYIFGANGAATTFTLTANTWQHLALVKEDKVVRAYINGTLVNSAYHPNSVNYANTPNLILGNWNGGNRQWQGEMDEVRIWERALCQSEISNHMSCELSGTQTGLWAYYKMNQGVVACSNTGITTLTDETSNHNGTLVGFNLTGATSNFTAGQVSGACSNVGSSTLSTTLYQDLDGDGYGNPNISIVTCSALAGFVANNTDCNDNNATEYISLANAGTDITQTGLTFNLNGSPSVGTWSVVPPPSFSTTNIADVTVNNTTVTNLPANTPVTLRWTVSTGSCPGYDDVMLTRQALVLNVKALLAGPLDASTGKMNDALRTLSAFPTTSPYGGMETINSSVLTTTGDNAIVDWVQVQLRSNASTVVATQAALIQKDGDIVGLDGVSSLEFPLMTGSYHVAVLHRNHLGVMTAAPLSISNITPTVFDFTTSTATYGTNAQRTVGSYKAMWAGDANGDKVLKYSNTYNDSDRKAILTQLGVTTPTGRVKTGYYSEDTNMDGKVKFSGVGNDRIIILKMIGGSATTTNTITQTFQ